MAQIEFIQNSQYTNIPCNFNERFKDILKRYINITGNDLNSVYYLYSGNIIEKIEELTFNKIANKMDKERNKMTIQINKINNEEESIIKSKIIICPKCYECTKIKIKDYKINLYGCKNNHNINNILLDKYLDLQNIDESKIICKCGNKKSISYQRLFYRCNICKINLCIKCKNMHDKNHKIIDYDNKYYYCEEHNDIYTSYCKNCNKNICILCEREHNNHEIISYGKIISKKEDLINKKNELRNEIDKMNNNIKEIINKLNKVIENFENYYKIINYIVNNYNINNRNYEILKNIDEINKNNIINEIKKINNENNNKKIIKILDIYDKMLESDETNIKIIKRNNDKISIFEEEDFIKNDQNIRELEYIIKKKDLEIVKLKKKLVKYKIFDFIYILNNDEDEYETKNQNKLVKDVELNIIYYSPTNKNNDKIEFKEYCNLNEKFKKVRKRIEKRISEILNKNFKNLKFTHNNYEIHNELTLAESGLTNNATIIIINVDNNNNDSKIYLKFMTSQGVQTNFIVYRGIPISIVLIFYLLRKGKIFPIIDLINGQGQIVFLYNACRLRIKDERNVGEIFGNEMYATIVVNDVSNLRGG